LGNRELDAGGGVGGGIGTGGKMCKLNNNVCFIEILNFLTTIEEATSSTAAVMD
jgi:hypothetical protein